MFDRFVFHVPIMAHLCKRSIIFCIIGIAAGIGGGYVVAYLSNEGFFTQWQLLDSSQKFEFVEDATSLSVWARGIDGKLYGWNFNCRTDASCMKWVDVNEIPEDIHTGLEKEMQKSGDCQSMHPSPRRLPGKVVECANGHSAFESSATTYYALLDDGTIWAWRHTSSMLADISISFIFAILGFVAGIIAFIVFTINRAMKNNKKPISPV
ncbi:MAG: hypothetical protein ACOYZ6_17285 [Chloroflexota bacterium]